MAKTVQDLANTVRTDYLIDSAGVRWDDDEFIRWTNFGLQSLVNRDPYCLAVTEVPSTTGFTDVAALADELPIDEHYFVLLAMKVAALCLGKDSEESTNLNTISWLNKQFEASFQ